MIPILKRQQLPQSSGSEVLHTLEAGKNPFYAFG
jgi:hypothetical protein